MLVSRAHGVVEDAGPGPAAVPRSTDGGSQTGQRHPRPAGQLKKDLKDGRVQIEGILLDPPEYVSTAKVFDMLMAVPEVRPRQGRRLLNQCRISQSKTVGGLSERQRAELIGLFNR